MTVEEAIWYLTPIANSTSLVRYKVALGLALAALRAQQELKSNLKALESNKPLTLDELRQMDWEPVWIVEYPDWGHWELSGDAEDYLMDREPAFYGMKYDDQAGRYGLHKLGWLAYSHKQRRCKDARLSKLH